MQSRLFQDQSLFKMLYVPKPKKEDQDEDDESTSRKSTFSKNSKFDEFRRSVKFKEEDDEAHIRREKSDSSYKKTE